MRLLILAAFALVLPAMLGTTGNAPRKRTSSTLLRASRMMRARNEGPVRVSWDLSFKNNDPATSEPGSEGTVFFYENVTVPVLKGASGVSAVSSSGVALDVALEEVE